MHWKSPLRFALRCLDVKLHIQNSRIKFQLVNLLRMNLWTGFILTNWIYFESICIHWVSDSFQTEIKFHVQLIEYQLLFYYRHWMADGGLMIQIFFFSFVYALYLAIVVHLIVCIMFAQCAHIAFKLIVISKPVGMKSVNLNFVESTATQLSAYDSIFLWVYSNFCLLYFDILIDIYL